MFTPFNQDKACDAVVQFLEEREGATRTDARSPEADRHVAPIDYACRIGNRLFALEHTGIEPFPDQIELGIHLDNFLKPVTDALRKSLPAPETAKETYILEVPLDAPMGIKPKKIPDVQNAVVNWVRTAAPTIPVLPYGRRPKTQPQRQTIADVPFPVLLLRWRNEIPSPFSFVVTAYVSGNLETARLERIGRAYHKKVGQLAPWKRDGARTVLVLEDNDRQFTNAQLVTDAILKIVGGASDRPDEIHMLSTFGDPWWLSPILVDDTSLFDVGDYQWARMVDAASVRLLPNDRR